MNCTKQSLVRALAVVFALVVLVSMKSDAWTDVITQAGVTVSSITERETQDGISKEYVILRIENTNSHAVTVTWYLEAWYNGVCRSCGINQPNDYNKKIDLSPGEVLTGFSQNAPAELRIFKRFPDKPEVSGLSSFNLADFTVIAQ